MERPAHSLAWTVGPSDTTDDPPVRRVPAQVPGAVQLDWARAEDWPPYWQGENARAYRWMENKFWIYRTSWPVIPLGPDEQLWFRCGGVDYRCSVRINGCEVHAQEGMFTPFEVDVTAHAGGATLDVVVWPAPKEPSPQADRREARACVKPAVSYGWDFHPRLISLGIWEETALVVRSSRRLIDAELRYSLSDDLNAAGLILDVETAGVLPAHQLHWTLTDPRGNIAARAVLPVTSPHVRHERVLLAPELWWPHDHGAQPLYTSTVDLCTPDGSVLDRRVQRVGFRRVRLVLVEELQQEPPGFPKSRRPAPTTFEVNGRRIFAKGSNWITPEIFPGTITAESYRPLLVLAKQAHFNLLRAWGGGPVPKESFFDLCDELGLLVWQEFPLACNPYPDDPAYLRVLEQESRSIVRRVRRHPCLALWCGGNELFNSWSGMTDQALPLRLLNRTCYELDPTTPFMPTSPLEGVAHGDYRFRDESGRDVYSLFAGAHYNAYPEFGCPGPAPLDALPEFIPAAEVWPPQPTGSWLFHHGFNAWELEPTGWLALATQRHYFGEPHDLAELVARGSWLQAEGLKCLFEEARRQRPRCGMALNWCFNEPWPAAANNSLVHWPVRPKPALQAVTDACRALLVSARIPKFCWHAGETFTAELWVLHDAPIARPGLEVEGGIHLGKQWLPFPAWSCPAGEAATNVRGPRIELSLPAVPGGDEMLLEVSVRGHPELASRYRLHYRATATA